VSGLEQQRGGAGPLASPAGAAATLTEQDRVQFHDFDEVILVVRPQTGSRLDTREGLTLIKRLHASLLELPGVERPRLRSLASLIDPPPWTPFSELAPVLDDIPEDRDDFARLLARLRGSVLSRSLYLCTDGDAAAIYVRIAGGQDRREFVSRLTQWTADTASGSYRIDVVGSAGDAADDALRRHLWGSPLVDVVLTAPRALFFHEAEGARLLERLSTIIESDPNVRGTLNPLLAFRIAARTLGFVDIPVSELPPEALTLISQQLQLGTRRVDFDQVLTFDGRAARFRVFLNDLRPGSAARFVERMERRLTPVAEEAAVAFHFNGGITR
jgi:hypothetical protein